MAQSLYLNKTKIDIYDKPIVRKLQIGDISTITERKSSYSYTINIPRTARNLKILDMLSVIGNNSMKPFEEVVCDYVVDGIYLVENGSAIIKSSSGYDISINMIDGFRGLSNALGDSVIADIDFSDLNHELNAEEIVDSFSNTEGYIYALADFGNGFPDDEDIAAEGQAPSIFLHTIVSRIFSELGYELIGDFFTTDEKYLNEVLTPCSGFETTPAGTTVVINDILGDLTQVEIIKDLANRHGLLIKPNKDFSGFEFKRLQEVLNKRTDFEDWSSKLVEIQEENYVSGYAQSNAASYQSADDATEDNDGALLVDNLNADDEATLFDSIFEMPANSGTTRPLFSLPAKTIYSIPIWGEDEDKISNIGQTITADSTSSGRRIATDGTLSSYANSKVHKYTVEVYDHAQGEYRTYFAKGWIYGAGYCMVAYYDDSDTFISYEFAGNDSSSTSYVKAELTVPNNTVYIRITEYINSYPILYEYSNISYTSAKIQTTNPKVMYVQKLACYIQCEFYGNIGSIPIDGQSDTSEYAAFLSTKYMSLQYSISSYYKSFNDILNAYKKITFLANLSLIDIHKNDFFVLKYLKQTGRLYYVNNIQNSPESTSVCEALEIPKFETSSPSTVSSFERTIYSLVTTIGFINPYEEIVISKANFFTNQSNNELNEPLKVKIISGFNSNIKLYQNNVLIEAEKEILYDELNLVAKAQKLDGSDYSEAWEFMIMDSASSTYSEDSATIGIEASTTISSRPTVIASIKAGETTAITLGAGNEKIFTGVGSSNPSAAASDDDVNKYYDFVIIEKPTGSTAYFKQDNEDYEGTLILTGDTNDLGDYTIRLTITTVAGVTDYEDMSITITEA